ncbi:MAG: hypothetical protein ACLFUJ_11700 [Phycisphaerae bacterium]
MRQRITPACWRANSEIEIYSIDLGDESIEIDLFVDDSDSGKLKIKCVYSDNAAGGPIEAMAIGPVALLYKKNNSDFDVSGETQLGDGH